MKIAISYPPLKSEKGTPLLSQNRQFQYFHSPTYIYPMVPAFAASLLKANGYNVFWDDGIAEELSYQEWLERIVQEKPDIIAIETKTPVIKRHWQIIDQLKARLEDVRLSSVEALTEGCKVVLMGDHVTALPEESLQNSQVDYVMSVDYSEPVFIREDNKIQIKEIGEFVDRYFENEEPYQEKEIKGVEVPVFDSSYKVKFAPLKKVIRHQISEPLYKVTLRSGRSVKVTKSHSIFILEGGQIIPKKVKDVKIGDYLICPSVLPNREIQKIDLWPEFKKYKKHIKLQKEVIVLNQPDGPKSYFPRYLKSSVELCKILGYYVAEGCITGNKGYPGKCVQFSFGYAEDNLVDDLKECLYKAFGNLVSIKIYRYKYSSEILVRVSNPLFATFLEKILLAEGGAENKRIPWLVFNVDTEMKIAFLHSYLLGDGTPHYIRKSDWVSPEFIAKTVSPNLANDLLYLLLQCGLVGSISTEVAKTHIIKKTKQTVKGGLVYKVSIGGKNQLKRFQTFIKKSQIVGRFTDKALQTSLEYGGRGRREEFFQIPINHSGLTKLSPNKFLIRGARKAMSRGRVSKILSLLEEKGYSGPKLEDLKRLVNSELCFLPITKIQEVESTGKFVYDLSVGKHEKFVGGIGGFFLHNTGGDYDFMLLNLANHLAHSEALEPGWYYKNSKLKTQNSKLKKFTLEGDEIISTGPFKLNHNLDALPMIDRDLTKWRLYAFKNGNFKYIPGSYMMSGRDCFWGKCSFCAWTILFPGVSFRVRSAKLALDEVGELIKLGVKEIFEDSGSLPIGPWLKEFCQGMIARGYNKKVVVSCNMRINGIKDIDIWKLMKQAGFRMILFGLESANQETLNKINKNLRVEEIEPGLKMCKQAGLEPHITAMIGYPWETKADAQRTIDLAKGLFKKGYVDTLQATVLIPYPGTPLYKYCQENNLLNFSDYDRFDQREQVMKSELASEDVKALTRDLYKSFASPQFIMRKIINIRSFNDLKFLVKSGFKLLGHLTDFSKKH